MSPEFNGGLSGYHPVDMASAPKPPKSAFTLRPLTVLNVLLLLAAVVAFVLLAQREPSSPGIEVIRGEPPAGVDEIRVQVTGAVVSPGVVVARPGDRIADVIALAGGALDGADLGGVNLALRVRDQDAIYVPTRGEQVALTLVDINSSTQAELEELPAIGEVRAQAIIAGRPYVTTDELVEREILTPGVYEQIRALVTAR